MDKLLYVAIDDARQGPFDHVTVRRMLAEGRIDARTLCWHEGAAGWMPLGELFPELVRALPPQLPGATMPALPPMPAAGTGGDLQIAGIGDRFIAGLVDMVIMAVLAGAFAWLFVIGGVLLDALYVAGLMCSSLQGTLGMKLMDLQVVDARGGPISAGSSILRYLVSFLSFFILLIGYLMIFFSARNQTLHDLVAGTYVVKRPRLQPTL